MTTRDLTRVPTLDVRDRIPQEAIEEVVHQIVTQFHPQQVILFGSYGYGRPRPESDVDLLVVMDTPLKETEQAARVWVVSRSPRDGLRQRGILRL